MRTVYLAETLIDAHLVKDALERAEIPAFVAGEYLTGGVGQLPARDFVAVQVPAAAVPAAQAVVREIAARLAQAREAAAEPACGLAGQPAS
ncbi:putative signal transducing protein [Fulvimonas soli]|jgi:hypothetical protein|uniref:Putative signal transducing protein n=1 Tax=Fulvimonas soli TaxID=155197 RepID=A0A316I6D0_9GAMM|nr:DUF2007 domain-containing protein [Fulvimonas soli]PWK88534.1 putative signal transducing protein [Fulvimonas soli]TNY27462.1 hypothetical protein BV497_03485 [Fulvimonas soli]